LKAECGKPGQNTDHRIGQPLLALAIDRSGGLVQIRQSAFSASILLIFVLAHLSDFTPVHERAGGRSNPSARSQLP